jgi:4-hydroxyphenylpyruvate dioxygenase-like putative hemolysin
LFEGHINHLALEVDDIELATEKCIKAGLKMNYEGGLYKVSKDKLLIQTATMSEPVRYIFKNGKMDYVPYTFVELIQRGREGFEQENAKRIFTSTN